MSPSLHKLVSQLQPSTHEDIHLLSELADRMFEQVFGQALPHSLYTMLPGHSAAIKVKEVLENSIESTATKYFVTNSLVRHFQILIRPRPNMADQSMK